MIVTYRNACGRGSAEALKRLFATANAEPPQGIAAGEIAVAEGEETGAWVWVPEGPHVRLYLAVDPESRGCGIGRLLLRRAVARAAKEGVFSLLVAGIGARDRFGRQLLESEGFRRVGTVRMPQGPAGLFQYVTEQTENGRGRG